MNPTITLSVRLSARLVQEGKTLKVFRRPVSPGTLVEMMNTLRAGGCQVMLYRDQRFPVEQALPVLQEMANLIRRHKEQPVHDYPVLLGRLFGQLLCVMPEDAPLESLLEMFPVDPGVMFGREPLEAFESAVLEQVVDENRMPVSEKFQAFMADWRDVSGQHINTLSQERIALFARLFPRIHAGWETWTEDWLKGYQDATLDNVRIQKLLGQLKQVSDTVWKVVELPESWQNLWVVMEIAHVRGMHWLVHEGRNYDVCPAIETQRKMVEQQQLAVEQDLPPYSNKEQAMLKANTAGTYCAMMVQEWGANCLDSLFRMRWLDRRLFAAAHLRAAFLDGFCEQIRDDRILADLLKLLSITGL